MILKYKISNRSKIKLNLPNLFFLWVYEISKTLVPAIFDYTYDNTDCLLFVMELK